MVDLPLFGRKFTGSNGDEASGAELTDFWFIPNGWRISILNNGVSQKRFRSLPYLIGEDLKDWGLKPFRVLNAWVGHPSFLKDVRNCWGNIQVTGYAGFKLLIKLKKVKAFLKRWNIDVFGNVHQSFKG